MFYSDWLRVRIDFEREIDSGASGALLLQDRSCSGVTWRFDEGAVTFPV
jgi:hypothetical protein